MTTCEIAPGPVDLVEAIRLDGKRIGSILPRTEEWLAYSMEPNTLPAHFPFPPHGDEKLEILKARTTARKTAIAWLTIQWWKRHAG